jgi:ABC-type transport system involved in multi-copper enzyme maturation permease subunit
MNPLLAKEIRLLLPAFGMALLLAVAPVWLLPNQTVNDLQPNTSYPFLLGTIMLAVSSFGREFTLNMYPLVMAQPLARSRVWWTKVVVLMAASATVFGAWCLACGTRVHLESGEVAAVGLIEMAIFAGALWTTLLLRQITAAFWLTILVPAAVATAISAVGGGNRTVLAGLGLYSIAGFLLAWWQFFRAQEIGWTGGIVAFTRRNASEEALGKRMRSRRPFLALAAKELQLHQIGLAGMGGLFALHLVVVALRKAGPKAFGDLVWAGMETFGLLWLAVPFLVGSQSVAEERKLGTMDGLMCLPVSRRKQFAIKVLFVATFGGLLSGILFCAAERIGSALGTEGFGGGMPLELAVVFVPLSLIAFYASTLSRNIIQALGIALVVTFFLAASVMICNIRLPSGVSLAPTILGQIIGWPTAVVTVLWLAYGNFRQLSENWRLWSRNILGLAGAFVFTITSTTATYHRAWEFLTPVEMPHGPPKLTGTQPALLTDAGNALEVLLPDGRLWVNGIKYDPGFAIFSGESTVMSLGGKWGLQAKSKPLPGSNWIASATLNWDLVALRSDGTLWLTANPVPWNTNWSPSATPAWARFGDEADWVGLARDRTSPSVLLLKADGTLWRWGTNHWDSSKEKQRPGLQSFEPHRLGANSNWARIFSARETLYLYLWQKNGQAWVMARSSKWQITDPNENEVQIEPGTSIVRWAGFDNTQWRSLTPQRPLQVGVRVDGSLWYWYQTTGEDAGSFVQLGTGSDWRSVALDGRNLIALKTDGTLWSWRVTYSQKEPWITVPEGAPVRLGINHDWLAVDQGMEGVVSLAADGSLWQWWTRPYSYGRLLGPSRKPSNVGNIFTQAE